MIMAQKKWIAARLTLALLMVMLVLAACGSGNSSGSGSSSMGKVSTITVTDQIETTGNLSADQLVTLTWGTSGLVDKVNVRLGQQVKAGDVLAILKSDSVPADIITAMATLATAQRDLSDLQDSGTALAKAQQAVVDARKSVEEAEANYTALNYPRASDALIKNTEAQVMEAEQTLTIATKQYKEVEHHFDGDPQKTQALLKMTNAQMALNELKATLNWYTAKPTQADYEAAKAALDLSRSQLEDARRERDQVKDGVDPLVLAAAQAKVDAAQAQVNAMAIIAPFDGEVIFVKAIPANSTGKGDQAIGLVNRSTIKIDTLIDESSISAVKVGNSATITMDSLPDVTLKGTVTLINPVGATVSGLVKYTVTVAVDPTDQPVLFGATASVTIVTSEPRSMLAVPIGAVQTDSSGEYVMRGGADGNTSRVDIQTGELSGNLVTLVKSGDLKDGDQIVIGSGGASSSSNNQRGPGGGPFGIGG